MTAPEKHPQHAGLDELRRRLDKARGIEQVLSVYQRILETAEELRSSPELRNRAAELKLQAQRKMGRLLATQHLRGGDRKSPGAPQRHHLTDLGITFNESARWQQEAAVPEPLFRRYCREMVDCGMEPTARGLARVACNDPSSTGMPDEMGPVLSLSPAALRAMAGQGRRFGCVHAAPPWPLDHPRRRDRKDFFKTMTRSLCDLPVADVCAESAHLYQWATPAAVPEAADVLVEWGFQYQSCVLWRNVADACDGLWRKGPELLLLWGPRRPPVLGGLTAAFDGSAKQLQLRSLAEILPADRACKSSSLS